MTFWTFANQYKKTTVTLAAATLIGSGVLSYSIGNYFGARGNEPISAELREGNFEKYPSLVVDLRNGKEKVLFAREQGKFLSGAKTLELRTLDVLKNGKK